MTDPVTEQAADRILYGRLVLPDRVQPGGLWLHNGRIAGIVDRGVAVESIDAQVIDYGTAYLLPGLIEVHGHLREPGFSHKEDYLTGTRAALAGGVTTVLDMPNTKPPTVTIADLHAKIELAAGRAYTDYAMIFGTTTDNQAEIAALEPGSVVGVKFFMAGHETTPTVVTDLGALYASLREVKAKGLVALFHAEHQGLINWLDAAARAANRPDDGRTYSESRSPLTAATAIREAVALCANLNLAAYICHVSTRAELTAIAEARRSGAIVYAEAVGYHLTFTIDEYESLGTLLKVSPPVRESVEREALWDALHGGSISTLASEHTPHTRAEKNRPMRAAASGMPGIQENLPMVISQYRSRYPQLPLDDLIHHVALLGSTHVAQIFGLSTHKGSIAIGQDADIAVLDPDQTWTIAESDLFSKCGWSAYTGRTTSCRVIATYLRGTPVYRDGQIIGEPTGKLLRQASG